MKYSRKAISYIVVIFFIFYYKPTYEEIFNIGIEGCYLNTFNYMFVGIILSAVYIYMIYCRLECFADINFIYRIPRKNLAIRLAIIEIIFEAIFFAFFNVSVFYIVIYAIYGEVVGNMFYFFIWAVITQIFGWISIGMLFLLVFCILDNRITSLITTEFILIIMFFAKSQTFSFRNIFYNIYNSIIVDLVKNNTQTSLINIMVSICISVAFFIIIKFLYIRKGIYGVEKNHEKI